MSKSKKKETTHIKVYAKDKEVFKALAKINEQSMVQYFEEVTRRLKGLMP